MGVPPSPGPPRPPWPWERFPSHLPEAREVLARVGRLSKERNLIEPGDRILLACSGGKDSSVLAWALSRLQPRLPFAYELIGFNIDQGFRQGYRQRELIEFLRSRGLRMESSVEPTGEIVTDRLSEEENPCWLCARMRRGTLYTHARRLGCNKVALGHHADDAIETLLLNEFFAGGIKAMPPKLVTDAGDLVVIRPMLLVFEETIRRLADGMGIPIFPCDCPNGTKSLTTRRHEIKRLLADLSERIPDLRRQLLASLNNVSRSHLWM